MVSQKCRYAIRALFELARRGSPAVGPVTIRAVAQAQDIPQRFLESILNQLRGGGFVESVRGKRGGYILAREPQQIRVGDVIRFMSGTAGRLVGASAAPGTVAPPLLQSLWQRAGQAAAEVLDGTTIAELVAEERARERQRARDAGDYCI